MERCRINPRTWQSEYLHACTVTAGRAPENYQWAPPQNRQEACLLARGSPGKAVETVPPEPMRYYGGTLSTHKVRLIGAIIAKTPTRHAVAPSLECERANGLTSDAPATN